MTCDAQGKTDEAIEAFTSSLRVRPDKSDSKYALARAMWKKGMAAESISTLEDLLKTDPDFARAHFLLGMICEKTAKRTDMTSAQYKRYLELEPDGPNASYVKQWLAKHGNAAGGSE